MLNKTVLVFTVEIERYICHTVGGKSSCSALKKMVNTRTASFPWLMLREYEAWTHYYSELRPFSCLLKSLRLGN
jgi:hypothetical protein